MSENAPTQKSAEKSKPPRIALLASDHVLQMYGSVVRNLLLGMTEQSFPVALVCPPHWDLNTVMAPGVEVFRYPICRFPGAGHFNRAILLARLEEFRPTLLHCLCESEAPLVRRLARRLNKPYVLDVNALQQRFGRLSYSSKRLASVIVPTPGIADSIQKAHPKLASKIDVLEPGTFSAEEISAFRKSNGPTTLVVSISSQKALWFGTLIGAIRHLAIDGHEIMLVVISNKGADERYFRRLVREVGLSHLVTIIPRRSTLRSVVASGDVYVRFSPDDAYDPLLLEAMAVGTVVASCKGGVDDMVLEEQTAYTFDADDELSLHACLERILNKRESARTLARESLRRTAKQHSVSVMIERMTALYFRISA